MRWSDGVDPALADFVAGYRTIPGVHDELMDAEGRLRPHWLPLLSRLARIGRPEIEQRFAGADRYLRESGVVFRSYEEDQDVDRPWPLAHLPIVIDAADWAVLARGVEQRARLFEALLADLMGHSALVEGGVLPAALVAGNPEFLRPLAGVAPADGHFLHLYAADVTRAPDGRWWVLTDRTQAPSGAGYAIENRIALSRALPESFEDLAVERLGPFFQALRGGLARAAGGPDEPRIALLTPGSRNETYFEHAFLARCLGFQLEAEAAGEEGVFEIGLVARSRGEQRDARLVGAAGGAGEAAAQRLEEGAETLDGEVLEGFGQRPRQRDAVLDGVTGARRRLGAIGEDPPAAVGRAGHVGGIEMQEMAVGRGDAGERAQELGIAGDEGRGQDAALDQGRMAHQVGEQGLEQTGALLDAARQHRPVGRVDDDRQMGERPGTVDVLILLVGAEDHAGFA